jgi:hypothetical protein
VASQVEVSELLRAMPGVAHVIRSNHAYLLEYSNDDHEAARLLRALIERGVPVTSFAPARESLEDVYLKTGVKQVD